MCIFKVEYKGHFLNIISTYTAVFLKVKVYTFEYSWLTCVQ